MSISPNIIRTVELQRYVTPLREGGSMPAIVEADDDFLYVIKFRGAGQGLKALIAELLGTELARALGFRVPELVFAELDVAFGRTEADEEIQDLLRFSEGLNLGLHYLSGSITFDPAANRLDELTASKVVWLDSLIMNVDRTTKNPNMLIWHKELWLIDHGAAFYFHHHWPEPESLAEKPFGLIKDHVLIKQAQAMDEADAWGKKCLNPEVLSRIVNLIPDDWLAQSPSPFDTVEAHRAAYLNVLMSRLAHSQIIVKTVEHVS